MSKDDFDFAYLLRSTSPTPLAKLCSSMTLNATLMIIYLYVSTIMWGTHHLPCAMYLLSQKGNGFRKSVYLTSFISFLIYLHFFINAFLQLLLVRVCLARRISALTWLMSQLVRFY